MIDLRLALEAASAAAVAAGEVLRADFHRAGGARGGGEKAPADVEAERVIRARLRTAFPDWNYLGEETGRHDQTAGAPQWLVDPNDATRDYLVGRRGSAVSIALLYEARPVLGVVLAFVYPDSAGDLFCWAEGCGPLRRNGKAVQAALPVRLGPLDVVLVSSGSDHDPEANLRSATPARFRAVSSIAHRLALVAAGEAAAATSIRTPGAWDYAAGHALLRACGGVLVDKDGREVSYAADGSSRSMQAFGGSAEVARELAGREWRKSKGSAGEVPASLIKGQAVADVGLLARAQGCLLGQVAGDSLGAALEGCAQSTLQARHADGPHELSDDAASGLIAGQPTDDSELALALARCVLREEAYVSEHVLGDYRAWLASEPFSLGQATRAALTGQPLPDSQANGSLMRASPLGILAHALPPERAAHLGRQDSALTHPHAVCSDAVAAFVVALAHAVAHGDGPRACYEAALGWARAAPAEAAVRDALEAAARVAPVCDGEGQGFVLITLQNAFHELLHAPSAAQGVVATVRRGGDTDTNAAVAGALLGAVHGRAAFPGQWRSMVLSCRAHELRGARPRPARFWPTDVLELAERLLLLGQRQAPAAR